jgi:hypothetical protein
MLSAEAEVKRKWLLMTEEVPTGDETPTAEVLEPQGKCTQQPVLTAELRHRYHSNPIQTDQFIAESVFQTTENQERTATNPGFF